MLLRPARNKEKVRVLCSFRGGRISLSASVFLRCINDKYRQTVKSYSSKRRSKSQLKEKKNLSVFFSSNKKIGLIFPYGPTIVH